ncbi:hypothetical protein RI367_007690 [Sorochytrium milnesiophthora]
MPASVAAPWLETADVAILGLLMLGGGYFLYSRIFPSSLRGRQQQKFSFADRASAAARARNASSASPAKLEDKSLIAKLTSANKNILILYGSQTGTAEEYANRLAKEASRFGLTCLTADPEDYDMADLEKIPKDKLVVFVVATYGEGEPTDNAAALHEYLTNGAAEHQDTPPPADGEDSDLPLRNLSYAVFGLGNKTYEQFNAVARNVDKWCTTLGAKRIGERGEGDDDANMEEDYQQWSDGIWKDICAFFNIDPATAAANSAAMRSYTLHEYTADDMPEKSKVYTGQLGDRRAVSTSSALTTFDIKNPFYAPVRVMRELFSTDAVDVVSGGTTRRNCIHAEIDLTGSRLTYQAGDHIAIWPTNPSEQVEVLAKALGLHENGRLDAVFSMNTIDTSSRKKHPFPCPTTFRTAFTHYLDISVPPRQHHFQSFLPHVTNPETLAYFTKLAESKEFYHDEIVAHHVRLGELLTAHPTPLPLDLVLESFLRIQPRYYSISSSPKAFPDRVHITASVLRYYTPGGKLVKGLATNYLFDMFEQFEANPTGEFTLPIYIRHSNFKLPRQNAAPVIMIGPGTGVAPFRGFIQERCVVAERQAQRAAAASPAASSSPSPSPSPTPSTALGPAILFFGCRNQAHDFLYADEWPQYISRGGLTTLVTAFSRDGPQKVYVQHRLNDHRQQLWDWVHSANGYIYVCGDAKNMARDVNKWFVDLAIDLGGMTEEKAVKYIKDMRNKGKYLEDVWS